MGIFWDFKKKWLLKRGKMFEVVKVISHEKKHVSRSYEHVAVVEIVGGFESDKFLCRLVSHAVGYNPDGYVMFGDSTVEKCAENIFRCKWNTWDSCD